MHRISQFLITSLFALSLIVASAQADAASGPLVELRSQYSGKCLAVKGGSMEHGAGLMHKQCGTGDLDALWELRRESSGHRIVNQNSGFCIGVAHAGTSDGARVKQIGDCGRRDTLWKIEQNDQPIASLVYDQPLVIKNNNSGKCLALVSGDVIKQYGCPPHRPKTQWKLVKIDLTEAEVYKRVFVTHDTFPADFRREKNPDDICQSRAEAAGLPGKFRAWVSVYDYGECEGMRMDERGLSGNDGAAAVPYMNICSGKPVKIADSFSDLVDGSLYHPISCTEQGLRFSGTPGVWTGTRTDGRTVHYDNCKKGKCPCRFIVKLKDDICCLADCCDKYTTAKFKGKGGEYRSLVGNAGANDKNWTQYRWLSCHDNKFRLYCFEE